MKSCAVVFALLSLLAVVTLATPQLSLHQSSSSSTASTDNKQVHWADLEEGFVKSSSSSSGAEGKQHNNTDKTSPSTPAKTKLNQGPELIFTDATTKLGPKQEPVLQLEGGLSINGARFDLNSQLKIRFTPSVMSELTVDNDKKGKAVIAKCTSGKSATSTLKIVEDQLIVHFKYQTDERRDLKLKIAIPKDVMEKLNHMREENRSGTTTQLKLKHCDVEAVYQGEPVNKRTRLNVDVSFTIPPK
eukprot:c3383_g1_i1.p1 GENE.c3383_g1_i1~~c3383_g1_i1.p1  ORF type:complete len:258 (+),score=84.52 c3383_g1_i1:42-776(+)